MSNDQQWWDEFWARQGATAPRDTLETWHGVVWQVALEDWYELFEKLAPGKTMLECGCGSARVSLYMAQRGYECTLLDRSDEALALARRGFDALALRGGFVRGDINDLGVRSEQFDLVYSGGVLEFFGDIERPVAEMVRVLKPSGVFAATVVPPKFSIQTLADLERTAAHALRNLTKGRLRDAFQRVRHIPRDYRVKSWSLRDYLRACERAGLTSVTGVVTTPFPALAIPKRAQRFYARAMRALIPQWRRFNESRSRWSEVWGITYTIHGIKGRRER